MLIVVLLSLRLVQFVSRRGFVAGRRVRGERRVRGGGRQGLVGRYRGPTSGIGLQVTKGDEGENEGVGTEDIDRQTVRRWS
jgi:hypothetical protein